ncbi:MAG TPA: hypothetical protein VLA56_17785 [Pseudomonadales bacterium]|nr:hypothetical protein [Pseudomonadales bacterium]
METFAADFTITWDAGHGHRFEGRYGAQSIRGHSRIAGSERIDVLDGAAEARHASIESATYRAADDYRYVLREDGRMPRRSTITRLGDLQVNMVDALGAASRPLRICSYRLEPRAADQPTAPPSAIPADSSAARLAASRS